MILIDAGPLTALLDRRDAYHAAVVAVAELLPSGPLTTTWPCLAEAMYLIGRATGWAGQAELWGWVTDGQLILWNADFAATTRMAELMESYNDLPMDLADASLIVDAEVTGVRRVFTLDRHFRAYRLKDGSVMDVVP